MAKAFANAQSFVYIEDQYLWSTEVAAALAQALQANTKLQVIAVVPRYPDADGPLAGPPIRIGQLRALRMLHQVAPDRIGVFDLENSACTPIYVHAKICIVDDAWMTCGSANFNRRSWTTDSELTCAVVDTTGQLAGEFRRELWAEHLGLEQSDPQLDDPADGLKLWNSSADALDEWHKTGRFSRPLGQIRHHITEPVPPWQRFWAAPMSRLIVDPDGRPRSLRGTAEF